MFLDFLVISYQEELLSETKRADKFSIEAEKYKAKCEATENDNFNLLQGLFKLASLKLYYQRNIHLEDYYFVNNSTPPCHTILLDFPILFPLYRNSIASESF